MFLATFKMAAMTSFHVEKCCHLVSEDETFALRLSSSVDSSRSIVQFRICSQISALFCNEETSLMDKAIVE